MNYIVFDLEWNQASSKEYEIRDIMFEILEIGAVKLNEEKRIVDKYNSLIKPQVYKKLHYMTKKVVHLDIEKMQHERPFKEVMKEFLDWCGEDYVFCTWGTSDLTELQRNMKYYRMPALSKGPLKFLDIQKLFSLNWDDGKSRKSLEKAVEALDLEKSEEFHRALSDAYYTSLIFSLIENKEVEKYCSFDNFYLPETKDQEIKINFPTYSKYISRVFKNKNIAITDLEVLSMRCNVCNMNSKRKIKWFSPSGGKYYLCIAKCINHGYIKSKVRIKKSKNDSVYVVKTTKLVNDKIVDEIMDRYHKSKSKNQNHQTQTYNGDSV